MPGKRLTKAEQAERRAAFESWLAAMDDSFEMLRRYMDPAVLPPEFTAKLDGSIESLNMLEDWLIDYFPDLKTMYERHESTEDDLMPTLSERYVGEVYRQSLGWEWDVILEPHQYFDEYVIRHPTEPDLLSVPRDMVSRIVASRGGRKLRDAPIDGNLLTTQLGSLISQQALLSDYGLLARELQPAFAYAKARLLPSRSRQKPGAKILKAKYAEFDAWLADMEPAIAAFKEGLPTEVRSRLDGSLESLEALGEWLVKTYAPGEISHPSQIMVLDGAARYVGETGRRFIEGPWRIHPERPTLAFHDQPCIGTMNSPMYFVGYCVGNADPGAIARLIRNNIRANQPREQTPTPR